MHAARTVRFDVFGVLTTTQDPRRPRRGPANSLLRTPPLPLLQCQWRNRSIVAGAMRPAECHLRPARCKAPRRRPRCVCWTLKKHSYTLLVD